MAVTLRVARVASALRAAALSRSKVERLPAAVVAGARALSTKVTAPPEGESHEDFLPKPRKPAAAAAAAAPPDATAIYAKIDKVRQRNGNARAHSAPMTGARRHRRTLRRAPHRARCARYFARACAAARAHARTSLAPSLRSLAHAPPEPSLARSLARASPGPRACTQLVRAHPVVLFMKGTPSSPQCGFSAQAVRLLHAAGADVHGVNILEDAALRAALKDYSKWPTFPQAYVLGDFVGGCDILTGMQQSGELAPLIARTKAKSA